MASTDLHEYTVLEDDCYDDPEALSQLLLQRADSHIHIPFTDSTDHLHSANARSTSAAEGSTEKSPQGGLLQFSSAAATFHPRDPPARRVQCHTSHVKPSLPIHNTAPTSTAFATERVEAAKMYQTFDGVMDVPGDTQPDSQIFKQYTSGILGSNSNLAPVPQALIPAADDASAEPPTDEVEVLGSSQSPRSPTIISPTVINDDSETPYRLHDPLTSPLKFETPAIAGKKRDSHGQVLSSIIRPDTTPGTVLSASAFFGFGNGGNGNSMSLTQAFNATQARTSPAVGAPSEDPVFQRPSPNFVNNRQRHSSPGAALSSPIKGFRGEFATDSVLRSSSEPRADYETMKQSQDRRKHATPNKNILLEAQDSWDEPSTAEKIYHMRKAKERLADEAAKSLASISAPSPLPRRGKKRGLLSMTAKYQSPQKAKASGVARYDGPQDSDADESPDELSQPAPSSSPRGRGSPDEPLHDGPSSARASRIRPTPVKQGNADQRVQVPNTSSHPLRTLSGQSVPNLSQADTPSQLHRASLFRAPASTPHHRNVNRLRSSKDPEVIMETQPDPDQEIASSVPPRPDPRFPSSPSANQYSINQTVMTTRTGFTSQVVPSSLPPMPPGSSSQQRDETLEVDVLRRETEEGVPSSPPPIAAQEDEIKYDEHAYDEHSEDEQGSRGASMHEDEDEDEEDDLPVVQAEVRNKDELRNMPHTRAVENHDDEVPETLEQEEPQDLHDEEEELIRSSHPEDDVDEDDDKLEVPMRGGRRSTIPETDMLDETQPSFFPEANNAPQSEDNIDESPANNDVELDDTNDTAVYHTGKEHQSASLSGKVPGSSAKEGTKVASPARVQVRSLLEIANQPGTQHSTELEGIEIPQLSFAADPDDPLDAMLSDSSPARPRKKRKILYSSKKKTFRSPVKNTDPASDQPLSSPLKQNIKHRSSSVPPALTQVREEQGALAAAQARKAVHVRPATLRSKSKTLNKSNQPQTPRKGALKTVSRELLTKSSPFKTPPKSTSQESTSVPDEPVSSTEPAEVDVAMRDADDVADVAPASVENGSAIVTATDDGEAPEGQHLVPNRVFAFWPGKNYFPATCLGRADGHRLRIRYDDGNITSLEPVNVRALDLHSGDQVKVDMPGMKKNIYVVVGFKHKIDTDDPTGEYPLTDRHGYATVILEEKHRDSLPASKKDQPKKHIAAPLATIYLTNQLWTRIRDRFFKYSPPSTPNASTPRVGTPVVSGDSGLPTPTFLRRSTAGPSLLRDSTARAGSIASSTRSGDAFVNMAFAITLTNDALDKDAIGKLITSNGGQILDAGFHELFDIDTNDAPMSSEGTAKVVSGLDGLLLKREYKDLGFVALISDSHSRRTKHVQALALNIPCLHLRWVQDSVSASRPLHFAKYLLPAGLSTYLDPEGVVRSRNMAVYDPSDEKLTFISMIKHRDLILRNQSILLITGKSKKEIERKQPYVFLTHALGPVDVGQCRDLAAAKDLLRSGDWDWVYVDGGPAALAAAAAILLGAPKDALLAKKTTAKKRRRDEGGGEGLLVRSAAVAGRKVSVACDEFVVQSLILGALVDE